MPPEDDILGAPKCLVVEWILITSLTYGHEFLLADPWNDS